MNHLGNNSEFLQTFSPYQFLKDDQNKLDTLLNRIELAEFLNLLFTASPPDFETVCNCLKNRHEKNSNYAPLMRAFVVDSASLMNLFLAMEMTNYGDLIPALAARLGFENLDIEEAKNQLCHYVYGNNGNGSNLKRLFDELYGIDEGFRDCGPSVSNFLFKLHTDQPNKLIELLVVIPELRDMFYRTASSDGFDCSCSFSHDDMASLMSNNYPEISWNKLIEAFGTNTILSYFVNNQNSYFMNQAVLYNKSILTNTQQNQNLYGGNYGGLENYFTYIRNYFGQGLYDQITAGFMQQSSVYTDSLRLEEWHMYGSARIGIYQTNKAMAQRTVRIENGVTTQLSNTNLEQLSLSRFYTERGAKRYELTNHLGNVLTVITDKKLPVCSGTSVSYFIADVVSATDYSPFGAPLSERTWQGSEYRFGFNGKEKDDETYGGGNIYDYGFRIYNPRLGKFISIDPLTQAFPWFTPYLYAGNKPINFIDLDGLEESDPIPEAYYYSKTKLSMTEAPAGSNLTAGGYKRNGPWYWRQMLKNHPEMFSKDNEAAVRAGKSPIVDDVWISHNQTHMGFKGDKLIHHHIDQGNIAVAIPEKVHKNWSKSLHSTIKGGRVSAMRILGKTLNAFGTAAFLADILSDDPHSLGSQFELVTGKAEMGKLYFDDESKYYFAATDIQKTYYDNGNVKSVSVTYDYYEGYYYDEEKKSFLGFDKKGTKTEIQNYDENGKQITPTN